tara:strand:- start:493 stop:1404 length:912 start_codon:yes stop_codon:yes gene_type:complete
MIGCDCNAGLSNTGRPNCVPIFGITSSLIVVPKSATDGTINRIDLSTTLPTWSSLVNEADASKRWFPLPAFENVELPKADSLFEEANSGRQVYLRQGKRSFTGELWSEDSTPTFLGKLSKSRCVDFGVFIVDVYGNLIGSEVDGFLYPISVDNPSWDPKFMFATDSTTQKIMLGFDFNRIFDESTMYMINPTEAGQDFTTLEGLVDVNLDDLLTTTTQATFKARFDYGTAVAKIKYEGATLVSDWIVTNLTTAATWSPDAVTENPEGDYLLDYSTSGTATAGDNIKIEVSKLGFDGEGKAIAT